VAFDLDRDDWRTFRLDRIKGRVRESGRGRRRTVPGGDPAAYVQQQLGRRSWEEDAVPGRVRLGLGAEAAKQRIPGRYATIEPDGDGACIVSTRGSWSHEFLVWMALMDAPIEVLGPPELVDAARSMVTRLAAAA
jgi:predicted DNA-binding transcriptional regulator YafY